MQWYWLAEYSPLFLQGLLITIELFVISIVVGMSLAIPIGLAQVTGPKLVARIARGFCTAIRSTPLLIQLWLIHYGLGSLYPFIPGLQESFLWPILEEGFTSAAVALTLSVAGYEGEVMRSAFQGVPRGELEAARAFGMSGYTTVRRVWLPRALQNVFPTLAGETILAMKATALAGTIPVIDVYGASTLVRSETYRIYEPLLLIAVIYLLLTAVISMFFRWAEHRVPRPR